MAQSVKRVKGSILIGESVALSDALHAAFPGIHLLVYTMGGEGSVVYDYRDGIKYESGVPEKVKVVSTVGAGDCYSAAFVSYFLSEESIPECIKTASHRSGIVVASTEAIPDSLLGM